MTERYKRAQSAIKELQRARFTKFCLHQLSLERPWARTNIVFPSTPTTARIQQANGNVYFVDLVTRTCTCRKFQENGIPCGHAIAWIMELNDRPLEHYLPNILSLETWQATYNLEQNLKPVNIEHLPTAPGIFPPITLILRGRPRKARVRIGEARQRAQVEQRAGAIPNQPDASRNYRCQTCGNLEHNSATCATPHE